MPPAPVKMSRIRNTVVSAAPTSTTNITGFFISVIGIQLRRRMPQSPAGRFPGRTAGGPAPASSGSSDVELVLRNRAGSRGSVLQSLPAWSNSQSGSRTMEKSLPLMHQVVLDDRAERKRRERRSARRRSITVPTSRPDEQRTVRREGAARGRDLLLGRQAAGHGQQRDQEQEAADEHRQPDASGCTRACWR